MSPQASVFYKPTVAPPLRCCFIGLFSALSEKKKDDFFRQQNKHVIANESHRLQRYVAYEIGTCLEQGMHS